MLIGIDSSPCSLSLRNRSTLCSTTKCHQIKSDLKNVFVQKSFFFQNLLFCQSESCLLESTAAIFRQSAGYVHKSRQTRDLEENSKTHEWSRDAKFVYFFVLKLE